MTKLRILFYLVFFLVVAITGALFVFENLQTVDVELFFMVVEDAMLGIVLLATFGLGCAVGFLMRLPRLFVRQKNKPGKKVASETSPENVPATT